MGLSKEFNALSLRKTGEGYWQNSITFAIENAINDGKTGKLKVSEELFKLNEILS